MCDHFVGKRRSLSYQSGNNVNLAPHPSRMVKEQHGKQNLMWLLHKCQNMKGHDSIVQGETKHSKNTDESRFVLGAGVAGVVFLYTRSSLRRARSHFGPSRVVLV